MDINITKNKNIPLYQLKRSEIPHIREKILLLQNGKCKLCEKNIENWDGISLDHQHKTKKEPNGINGAGLVRGVLCRDCNTFEGKIWNNSKRYNKHYMLAKWLRNLANFLDDDNYRLIHPSEKPKPRKISKRQYNKLRKAYANQTKLKAKFPDFPKKGYLTKKLENLFSRFNISPYPPMKLDLDNLDL